MVSDGLLQNQPFWCYLLDSCPLKIRPAPPIARFSLIRVTQWLRGNVSFSPGLGPQACGMFEWVWATSIFGRLPGRIQCRCHFTVLFWNQSDRATWGLGLGRWQSSLHKKGKATELGLRGFRVPYLSILVVSYFNERRPGSVWSFRRSFECGSMHVRRGCPGMPRRRGVRDHLFATPSANKETNEKSQWQQVKNMSMCE